MPRITICICVLLTLFCCLALGSSYLNAQPAADLRGKQGVVDPGDLKKHDPKPPAVRAKEPPPPAPQKSSPKGDTAPKPPPTDDGLKPRQVPVPVRTHPIKLPPPLPPRTPVR